MFRTITNHRLFSFAINKHLVNSSPLKINSRFFNSHQSTLFKIKSKQGYQSLRFNTSNSVVRPELLSDKGAKIYATIGVGVGILTLTSFIPDIITRIKNEDQNKRLNARKDLWKMICLSPVLILCSAFYWPIVVYCAGVEFIEHST
jgi:hypothetical protein